LKLAGHAQPYGPEIGNDVVAYRMWRDPRSTLVYPRLSRYPDAALKARVNHLLEQRHWHRTLDALDCVATRYTSDEPSAGTLGGFDEDQIQVTWLSTAVLGLTEAGSVFCGGAYPDNHFEPYTFDLLRGEYLDWNRVLRADQAGKDGDREPTAAMRAFIKQTKQARHKAHTDPNDEFADCAEMLPDYLAYALYAPDRLSFTLSGLPHVAGACLGPQLEVKLEKLTPVLGPEAARYLVPSVKLPSVNARAGL
jgi:hypothetical protein